MQQLWIRKGTAALMCVLRTYEPCYGNMDRGHMFTLGFRTSRE